MAVVKQGSVRTHIYYKDFIDSETDCFLCGKHIWRSSNKNETCVHWMGSNANIFLHTDCAQHLCISLIYDAKAAEMYQKTGNGLTPGLRELSEKK